MQTARASLNGWAADQATSNQTVMTGIARGKSTYNLMKLMTNEQPRALPENDATEWLTADKVPSPANVR